MQVMTAQRIERHDGAEMPVAESVVYTDDPQAWACARFRELADRIESGELSGARFEWRRDGKACTVEAFATPIMIAGSPKQCAVRLTVTEFKPAAERLRAVEG